MGDKGHESKNKEVFAEDLTDQPGMGGIGTPRHKALSEDVEQDQRAPVALVVCGILHDEVTAVLRQEGLTSPVFYLAPAPCINYANMERQLTLLLSRAAKVARRTVVLIGLCHPNLEEILARYNAERVPINDCFDALLGKERRRLEREANTFFTTPTWLRHWRRALQQGMGWNADDARQNFGRNQRILLLDAGVTPVTDEEILAFFDYTEVPVEPLEIDLSNLARLLRSHLDIDHQ